MLSRIILTKFNSNADLIIMLKKFIKWFLIMFMVFMAISYSIVIYVLGFAQTKAVFLNDFFYNIFMIFVPSFIVAILLTQWELKK